MNNKLHAIFQVRSPLGAPEHAPFSLWITTDERFAEAEAKGGITNLRRYSLDQTVAGYLDTALTGGRKERRNRAVSLDYSLKPQDFYNSIQAWETVPTPQEKTQLEAARDKYVALRDELAEEESKGPLSAEKAALLRDYRTTVQAVLFALGIAGNGNIIGNQAGFLEEIPSVFGIGGKCLHDLNNVPNVPKIRRSTFRLDGDRPCHLELRFTHPHTDQAETWFKIRWGPFVLEFRGGRSVLLSMYKAAVYGTGADANLQYIKDLEAQLDFWLDQGRLTAEDMDYLGEQDKEIRRLQKEVKDKKLQHDDPAFRPYYNAIQAAKERKDARRKLKQRAPGAAVMQAEVIKKQLYAFREQQVNLQESSENFYGDEGIVRLTMLPQRRGFLTFTLTNGASTTVDLPDIIETKDFQTVWNDSLMWFESNGGAVDWQFLYPTVDSTGEYRLKDVPVPFVITEEDDFALIAEADATLPGCHIEAFYDKSARWTAANPLYDFWVTLRSDRGRDEDPAGNPLDIKNAYTPWLYSLQVFINAGARPANDTILWNSADFGTLYTLTPGHPNPNTDNPIADVSISYDDSSESRRGARVQVDLLDPSGTLNFSGYSRHLCDLSCGLWNEANGVHGVVSYFRNLVITEAVLVNARRLDLDPAEFKEMFGVDSFWRLNLGDIWTLVDEYTINDEVILDGRTLGEALWILLGLMGWTAEDLAGIPTEGVAAGPVLPRAGAGEKPAKAPAKGVNLGHYIRDLMDEFGVTDDYEEMRLHAELGVFTLDVPSNEIKFAFSSAQEVTGPQVVMAGASMVKDWSRFYNYYEMHGQANRKTGEPLAAIYPILESIHATSEPPHPLFIGEEKRYPLQHRGDLDTQGEVERAVEILAIRNSKPGDFRPFKSWWLYPPCYPGDRGTVDGAVLELTKLDMSLKEATDASLVMRPVVPLP